MILLPSSNEIEKIARNILIGAKAYGKFPTPVDSLIEYSELSISKGVDLGAIEPSFVTEGRAFLGKVMRKVLGIFDSRDKTIYIDHSQRESRKNFVKLHETGHGVLSWQKDLLGYLDDGETISPEVTEEFEREASYFASSALFQMERFDEEAEKLPLSLRSARALANKFGGSSQAAIRRYVEHSKKRCSVLVLHPLERNGRIIHARVRNYFQSDAFTEAFGELIWPDKCGWEYQFVQEMQYKRKEHVDGAITVTTPDLQSLNLQYHFFDSTYNAFIFFFPAGEKNTSRVKILPAT